MDDEHHTVHTCSTSTPPIPYLLPPLPPPSLIAGTAPTAMRSLRALERSLECEDPCQRGFCGGLGACALRTHDALAQAVHLNEARDRVECSPTSAPRTAAACLSAPDWGRSESGWSGEATMRARSAASGYTSMHL